MDNNEKKVESVVSFTKGGDRGSSLIGYDKDDEGRDIPIRIDKDSLQMHLWGEIDELSSWIGCCDGFRNISLIQDALHKISGFLYEKKIDVEFVKDFTRKLERFCRRNEDKLKPEFVYPRGNLHYARALTRRVERTLVSYAKSSSLENIWTVVRLFNRLSSYFYVISETDDLNDTI